MKWTTFLSVLLISVYIAEGRTYGYGKRRKFVRSRISKLSPNRHLLSGKRLKDPCPPVRCALQHIPIDCLEKTFFRIGGVKCRGCDKNICMGKFDKEGEVFKKQMIKDISKAHILQKKKIEVPVLVPVEVPIKVPVEVPVKVPVEVPVKVPVDVPVRVPVGVPVRVPVAVPVNVPVPFQGTSSSQILTQGNVGPLNTPTGNLFNRDPVTVVNSPPTDNEFVNRLQFDRNNINLLQPQNSNADMGFPNANGLVPFMQNMPGPFQNQLNGNQWTGSPNSMNQNQMLLWQNQMAAAQLQARQAAAAQIQGQQLWGQPQQPTSQIPGQQSWGQFQTQQLTRAQGSGLVQPVQGGQGFPNFGFNPNPFVNGLQQQIPQSFLPTAAAGNIPVQTAGLLNQIPPVPGMNRNFQLQSSADSNNWLAPGQGNTQNSQGFSLVDPVTNQAIPGNLNSLHGPIGA